MKNNTNKLKFKGTPGPWHVIQNDDGLEDIVVKDNGNYVAITQNQGKDKAESDARLIAAAPELLKGGEE